MISRKTTLLNHGHRTENAGEAFDKDGDDEDNEVEARIHRVISMD